MSTKKTVILNMLNVDSEIVDDIFQLRDMLYRAVDVADLELISMKHEDYLPDGIIITVLLNKGILVLQSYPETNCIDIHISYNIQRDYINLISEYITCILKPTKYSITIVPHLED